MSARGPASPRLGFLGVGWIGLHRLRRLAQSGAAQIAAVCDPVPAAARAAIDAAPGAAIAGSYEDLLGLPLDGVVIATPSAFHSEQASLAFERGFAVFCQKPLGRHAQETARVVEAARYANRLLGVDLSYRHCAAMRKLRELVRGGDLGEVYAVDLVFHNAYGPDKGWFYEPHLSGGGCLIDLGIHLIDLAAWTLGSGDITVRGSQLFAQGKPLSGDRSRVEDYVVAQLTTKSGAAVQLACSWKLAAGRDAVIDVTFYGTRGGAAFRNVNGSFFDFTGLRLQGNRTEVFAAPPDDWFGRAAVAWAEELAERRSFNPAVADIVDVARTLDAIYESAGCPPS